MSCASLGGDEPLLFHIHTHTLRTEVVVHSSCHVHMLCVHAHMAQESKRAREKERCTPWAWHMQFTYVELFEPKVFSCLN